MWVFITSDLIFNILKQKTKSCYQCIAVKNESNIVSPVCSIQVKKPLKITRACLHCFCCCNKCFFTVLFQDVPALASKCTIRTCNPAQIEESSSSHKSTCPYMTAQNGQGLRSSNTKEHDVSASSYL